MNKAFSHCPNLVYMALGTHLYLQNVWVQKTYILWFCKTKKFKEMYETYLEFPEGGGGVLEKIPSMGRYGYFLELHNVNIIFFVIAGFSKTSRWKEPNSLQL